MVISNPTPHQIGKEFVKQYYTTLHESPDQLYRFYSADSSYVHGGWDRTGEADVVYGADQILKKVKELNFVQCHTKILQVDSFQTLGDGIVIQACGEISNRGSKMRRFMQTFVLGQLSARKFFVLNDIFRYQDDVFDTLANNEVSKEYVSKSEENNDDHKQTIHLNHGKDDGTAIVNNAIPDTEVLPQRTTFTKQNIVEEEFLTTNGSPPFSFEENLEGTKALEKQISNDAVVLPSDNSEGNKNEQQINGAVTLTKTEYENGRVSNNNDADTANNQRSWAAIASQNKEKTFEPSAPVAAPKTLSRSPKPAVNANAASSESAKNPRFAEARFSDSHQVFIGNLNVSTSEENLRSFFTEFGKIVEIRLNDKPVADKPNYAFIVFESPNSVDNLIAESKKHLLKLDGQRLNIERKNSRPTNFRGPKSLNRNFGSFNKQDRPPVNTKAY